MGSIKKVLSLKTLEPRSITAKMLWLDLCENIHYHHRNYRLEMSVGEFAEFVSAVKNLYKAAEHTMERVQFKEGDPNFLTQLQFATEVNNASDYFPNRLSLEWNRDDTYHLHYRDFRLHLTKDEFDDLADAFIEGKRIRDEFVPFEKKYGPFKEAKTMKVDIEDVQPYDAGHKPGGFCLDAAVDDPTREHEEGIKACMELIKQGKKIVPILVAPNGQRLDGYKRYMAFKRLGHKEIEVFVDPNGKMGGQHKMDWVQEESCASS